MTATAAPNITSRSTWAAALLALIAAPITQNNISTLVAWESAEGGAGPQFGVRGNVTNYNPINVGFAASDYSNPALVYGATPTSGNGSWPIASFPSWSAGLTATANRLQQPFAKGILSALQSDQPTSVVAAQVGASGWGTGDFSSGGTDSPVVANNGPAPPTWSGTAGGGEGGAPYTPSSIPGVPASPPGVPDPTLNIADETSRLVAWALEFSGWALLTLVVGVFGLVFLLLGLAVMVAILAGPAAGPIAAAVGTKSPVGKAAAVAGGAVSNRRASREASELETQARNAGPPPRNRREANRQAEEHFSRPVQPRARREPLSRAETHKSRDYAPRRSVSGANPRVAASRDKSLDTPF